MNIGDLPGAFYRADLDRVGAVIEALAIDYSNVTPLLPASLKTEWLAFVVEWGRFVADHAPERSWGILAQGNVDGPWPDGNRLLAMEGAALGFRRKMEAAIQAAQRAPVAPSGPIPVPSPGPLTPTPEAPRRPDGAPWLLLGAIGLVGFLLWKSGKKNGGTTALARVHPRAEAREATYSGSRRRRYVRAYG